MSRAPSVTHYRVSISPDGVWSRTGCSRVVTVGRTSASRGAVTCPNCLRSTAFRTSLTVRRIDDPTPTTEEAAA